MGKIKLIGKPQTLKEVNSFVIEQLVYEKGPLSKPEMVKITSLSLPTVSKLVDNLEKYGHLSQAGRTRNGAGRKAILYETNRNSGCIVVLYYEQGKYRCRIVDMLRETIYEDVLSLDNSSSHKAFNSTLRAIDSLIEHTPTKVKAIGIGLPGVVKPDGCLLGIPQIAVWEDYNLEKMLVSRYKARICIENNVKLSAVGYYHRLKEKRDNLVYIFIGNGMGAGLILNKQLYRGTVNFSGEIGFMTFLADRVPPKDDTSRGGFMETYVGQFIDYSSGNFKKSINSKQRDDLVNSLSMIAVNYTAILNPDMIVFSGKIFDETLLENIKRHIACYIPDGLIPEIMHDRCESTGIEGLILACHSSITTGIQLEKDTGQKLKT
jgi:predicted NBD/HSP70 family sugar kinase